MNALFVGAVLVLGLAAAILTDRSDALSRLAKMLASSIVIAVALVGAVDDTWAYFIVLGLALSWFGDLALSFAGNRAFPIGLVAFALAHVAYAGGFAVRGSLSLAGFAVGAAAMALVGGIVIRWLSPHRPPEMALPLAAYVTIIGLMVALALATHGGWSDWRIPMAAIAFAASDILVARNQFVRRRLVNRVVGLPLYFLAQAMFALVVTGPW